MPYAGEAAEYDTRREGSFSVTTMTLYAGRLGTEQWGRFMADIRSINPTYVVILMDMDPLTAFRQAMEFELFHLAMADLAQGRTVFVVSAAGVETAVHVRDGIRYINLAETYEYIHFRISGDEIRWSD